MNDWKNRIVGSGEEAADQLLANPFNARIHPYFQQQQLEEVLNTVGWVQRVIVNRTTGHVVDGHLRVALAISRGEPVPVDYVELTEDEEKLVLATFDWITQMAVYDREKLDALLGDIQSESAQINALLADLDANATLLSEGDKPMPYTRKIESPHYTPSGTKPPVSELYDDGRTRALVDAIEAAEGLDPAVRDFLVLAAQRHTVLRFDRIADYYAQADATVQRLMEESALVIIDFERAIELGFVRLTERISELVSQEYGDDA